MIELTTSEIANIVEGKLITGASFTNQNINKIVTDSRTYFNSNNSMFFAIKGPRNNGHLYVDELTKKGISVFVVSQPEVINTDTNFILVKNTSLALQKLAAYNRSRQNYPVIGITGSNGKTIIKEWLFNLLSSNFKIVRSPKSYNSQIGVPLSVLLMNSDYNLGIIEAGISQPGEMDNLASIISPELGIFTNIGDAHQENFISIQQKIQEKLRLFENSKQLISCADNEIVKNEVEIFCRKNSLKNISWSLKNTNADYLFSVQKRNNLSKIMGISETTRYTFTIPFIDDSSIENACHCFVATCLLLKNPETIIPRFKELYPVAMRLEIKQGIHNCILVNDFYNSDLNALSIALSVLHQQAAKEYRQKLVIISDIQQTGIPQSKLYKQVNELLVEWGIDEVIGIGFDISRNANDFSIRKKFYNSTEDFENRFYSNHFKSSAILIKGARQFTFEKISSLLQLKAHQTKLEINLNALIHNLNEYRNLLKPKTKIMVMVKAFSYGSGDVEIAKLLQYQNIDYLAVAVTDEGVQLRTSGITVPIIVMNPEQDSFQNIIDFRLEPNIYSLELLQDFQKIISVNGLLEFPVHLKIDTGMNRLGFKTEFEINEVIGLLSDDKFLKIKSVFTHLAASDEPDLDSFTNEQFKKFEKYADLFNKAFPYKIDKHVLNSAGIERFSEKQYDMVRLGIGLYGISNIGLPLENIGTLKSTISQVKQTNAGETVGYNRKGVIAKESKIAIIPLGYADGLDRKLGNGNGCAFVNGKRVQIIGNICMDMLMLDVSGVEVKQGDEVEFFGPNISIKEVAKSAGTIPYEVLTGISQRVKRVYIQE